MKNSELRIAKPDWLVLVVLYNIKFDADKLSQKKTVHVLIRSPYVS